MDTAIFTKILENGNLFIPENRQPLEEKEVIMQAEDMFGHLPDWFLQHKERLTLSRIEVDNSTKGLRAELDKLDALSFGPPVTRR